METQLESSHDLRNQFIRYVPLNVLGMLALSCYILADTFFVANGVGADGLTALNLVMPVYSLISGLGLLFGMGGATKYAIYRGSNDATQANKCFTLTMFLCVGTGIILMLIGAFFAHDICILLGADSTIAPLAIAIFAGISEGVQPLISNAYGADNQLALGKVFRWVILLAAVIGIALYLIVLVFAEPLVGAFNRDGNPILAQLATQGMRLYFPLLLLSGVNIVTSSLFASTSKAGASFLISSLRAFILVTAFVFVLSKLWGITGVWLTMPCTGLITFLVSLVLLKRIKKSSLAEGEPFMEKIAVTKAI